MILAPAIAIAIEGKDTEPGYESVRAWLHEPRNENRRNVLRGWFNMLEAATGAVLTIDAVLDVPYQLVHRAASACCQRATHRAVIYQVFDTTRCEHYLDELRELHLLVKGPALKLGVLATPTLPTTRYSSDVLARWDAGDRRMAGEVRAALLEGEAFVFDEVSLFLT